MAGDQKIADWIADKLKEDARFSKILPLGSGYLEMTLPDSSSFVTAAIGIKDVIQRSHVAPLFDTNMSPQFVVNVPSKAIWTGGAIDLIHAAPAAFGTLGDLGRAARSQPVSSYRFREYDFFEKAFRQHKAVNDVLRVYDKVFLLRRERGMPDLVVTLIDAYDMSAEDVRNAHNIYGKFNIAVKISSYGSVLNTAKDAAASMGAEALKFGELMGRIHKP